MNFPPDNTRSTDQQYQAGFDVDNVDDNNIMNDSVWPQDQPEQHTETVGQYDQNVSRNDHDQQPSDHYDDNDPFSNMIYRIQDGDPSMSKASFFDMGIGDVGAEEIAAALQYGPNTNVILMDLGRNGISDTGFSALFSALGANGSIKHLWMRDNYMGPQGAAALADALTQNRRLSELSLGRNQISSAGAADLASALPMNNTLTAIWLYSNEIGDDGAAALANALSDNTSLIELYLGGNAITEEGASALAYVLSNKNTTLTSLELNRNQVGNGGARALALSLQSNSTLTELSLRKNKIRFGGGCALINAAFTQGSSLAKLDLRDNSFTSDELQTLEGLVDRTMNLSKGGVCNVLLRNEKRIPGNFIQGNSGITDSDVERGPLLNGNGKHLEIYNGNDNDDHHELYDDVYSMLFLAEFPSRSFSFAVFTFLLKTLLFILVTIDLFSDGYPGNRLNIPSGISPLVRVAQFFMVLVTVAMQEDLISSMALVNVRYSDDILNQYPGATKTKWILGSMCRLTDGMFALAINFCILIGASEVLGMFLNFAALHFLGSVDNVAFHLAKDGYLGDHVERTAKAATVAKLPLEKDGMWKSFDTIGFVVVYLACLVAWCILTVMQMNGDFACQTFEASFGTETFGNLQPELFGGLYSQVGNRKDRINGRTAYMQDVDRVAQTGIFAYCAKDEVWGLIISANSGENSCDYQLYSANANDEYDVTAITDWYYRGFNDGGADMIASDFSLECLDSESS